jgi:hypothetical protein
MNVGLNMLNRKDCLLLVKIPSKNLNMARMNLKDEKLVKQKWFLKKLKLVQGGQGPS